VTGVCAAAPDPAARDSAAAKTASDFICISILPSLAHAAARAPPPESEA